MEEKAYKIDIVPLSVNKAWKGKRFKTPEYKNYEDVLSLLVPRDLEVPTGVPLRVTYWWGFSNKASDYDNPIKPFQDVLQKMYGFDDKMIFEGHVYKQIVPKGKEYLKFLIEVIA